MSETQPAATSLMTGRGPNMRGLVITMVIDAVIPFIIYRALTPHFPAGSVMPLLAASTFPALGNVISIVRQRRPDSLDRVRAHHGQPEVLAHS